MNARTRNVLLAGCATPQPVMSPLPTAPVTASVETDPVGTLDDAADDPAIWRNAASPADSLVVATDKQAAIQKLHKKRPANFRSTEELRAELNKCRTEMDASLRKVGGAAGDPGGLAEIGTRSGAAHRSPEGAERRERGRKVEFAVDRDELAVRRDALQRGLARRRDAPGEKREAAVFDVADLGPAVAVHVAPAVA